MLGSTVEYVLLIKLKWFNNISSDSVVKMGQAIGSF